MGQTFMCLDGGPQFEKTGAISFMVEFDDQAELDGVWEKLLVGGKTMQCGWITDKFGGDLANYTDVTRKNDE